MHQLFFGDSGHGISLASVLLFAALGLAITFGLMGVINMAHGEMLMLGAYTTYAVQQLFAEVLPGALRCLPARRARWRSLVTTLVRHAFSSARSFAPSTGARSRRCWRPGASA